MATRNDYLRALNRMRSNYQATGSPVVNPIDDTAAVGNELPSYGYAMPPTVAPSAQPASQAASAADTRNWWQRTWDTVDDAITSMWDGILAIPDGVFDFVANAIGGIVDAAGGDDAAFREAANYDWTSQVNAVLSQLSPSNVLSGDAFAQDYWDDWLRIGSEEGAQQMMAETQFGSYISDAGESASTIRGALQAIGQAIPSVVLSVVFPGSAPAMAALLATQAISAAGNQANEALNEGYGYGQAFASGAISGAIEAGTEFLPGGNFIGGMVKPGAKLAKNVALRIGQAFIEEGTEEFVGEMLGFLADMPLDGAEEAWQEAYGSPEAVKRTMTDAALSFLYGGIGGAVGGTVSIGNTVSRYGSDGVRILEIVDEAASVHEEAQRRLSLGLSADGQASRLAELSQEFVDAAQAMADDPTQRTQYMSLMRDLQSGEAYQAMLSADMERAGVSGDAAASFAEGWYSDPTRIAQSIAETPLGRMASQAAREGIPVRMGTDEDFQGDPATATAKIVRGPEGTEIVVREGSQNGAAFFRSLAHETMHWVADADESIRNVLVQTIEADPELSREFHSNDNEIEQSLSAFSNQSDQASLDSERLAYMAGRYVSNEKGYRRLLDAAFGRRPRLRSAFSSFLERIRAAAGRQDARFARMVADAMREATGQAQGAQGTAYEQDLSAVGNPAPEEGSQRSERPEPLEPRRAVDVRNEAEANNPRVWSRASAERAIRAIRDSVAGKGTKATVKFSGEGLQKASERLFRLVNEANVDPASVSSGLEAIFSDVEIRADGETIRLGNILKPDAQREVAFSILQRFLLEGEMTRNEKLRVALEEETKAFRAEISRLRERFVAMNEAIRSIERLMDRYKADKRYNRPEDTAFHGLLTIARNSPFYREYSRDGNLWRTATIGRKRAAEWARNAADTVDRCVEAGAITETEGQALDGFLSAIYEPTEGRSLTNYQLSALKSFYKSLVHFADEKSAQHREALRKTAAEMDASLSVAGKAIGGRRASSSLSGMGYDMARQNSVFDIAFGTSDNPVSKEIAKVVRARERYYKRKMDWYERYLGEADASEWQKRFSGFRKSEFKGFKITKAQAMAILTPLLDPVTAAEWVGNKNRYVQIEGNSTVAIDEADVRRLSEIVGQEDLKWATEKLRAVFGDRSEGNVTDAVRDFQLRTYGTTLLETRADYVPRWAGRDHLKQSSDAYRQQGPNANPNITKERAQSQSVGVIRPMFPTDAIEAYLDMAANEVEMKRPTGDALSILRLNVQGTDGGMRKVGMELNAFLKDGNSRYQDILASLNGGNIGGSDGLGSVLVGNTTLATFALNLPTAFRNLLSVSKVPSEVGLWNSVKAVLSGKVFNLGKYAKWLRGDPIWWARYHNNGFIRAAATIQDGNLQGAFAKSRVGRAMGKLVLAEYGDRLATLIEFSFHAAKAEFDNPGASQAEIREKALASWHDAVNRYQSTNEAVGKSRAQLGKFRGKPSWWAREFTRFNSDTTASATMIFGGLVKYRNSVKISRGLQEIIDTSANEAEVAAARALKAKVEAGRDKELVDKVVVGIMMLLVAGLGETAISDLFDRVFGRKAWDGEFGNGNVGKETLDNAISNLVPMYKTISYAVGNGEGVELYALSTLNQAIELAKAFADAAEDIGEGTDLGDVKWGRIGYLAAKAIGQYFGVPVSNLYNVLVGIPSSFQADYALTAKDWLYGYSDATLASRFGTAAKAGREGEAKHYAYSLAGSRIPGISTKVTDEIARLKIAGCDAMPKELSSEEWTDAELSKALLAYGEAGKQMEAAMKSASYRTLDGKRQAKTLLNVANAYKAAAEGSVSGKEPSSRLALLAYLGSNSVGKIAAAIAVASQAGTKEGAVEAVNSMRGLTKGERFLILWCMGYSISEQGKDLAFAALVNSGAGRVGASEAFA